MDAQARYDEIVDDLLHRHGHAERTQMMGMPSVKSNGKLLVGYIASQESMAVMRRSNPAAQAQRRAASGRSAEPVPTSRSVTGRSLGHRTDHARNRANSESTPPKRRFVERRYARQRSRSRRSNVGSSISSGIT